MTTQGKSQKQLKTRNGLGGSSLRLLAIPVIVAGLAGIATTQTSGAILQVGPTRTYKTMCSAVKAAQAGDTIQIDGGNVYLNDICTITLANLTIVGVGATRPILRSEPQAIGNLNGKATILDMGLNLTVDNIEFDGPRGEQSMNAIRLENPGTTLTVRHSYIHNTDIGILSDAVPNLNSEVLVEYSEFADNCLSGWYAGYYHNIYINMVKKLTFRYNYTHRCNAGHLVKSRAAENWILYNRITDETTAAQLNCPDGPGMSAKPCYMGAASEIDLPEAGHAYVIGNVIQRSNYANAWPVVGYARENHNNPGDDLYVINNTFVNDDVSSSGGPPTMVVVGCPAYCSPLVPVKTAAKVWNNAVWTAGTVAALGDICYQYGGTCNAAHNVMTIADPFVNRTGYDYHLLANAPFLDAGIDPGVDATHGQSLAAISQYVHPTNFTPRAVNGLLDAGAYEFGGSAPPPPPPTATLSGLACAAATASTWTCTASLSSAASAAAVVSLADNNANLTVPASVTISAGSASASFTATAAAVTTNQTATITATYNSVSQTAMVSLTAPATTATLSGLACAAATASTWTCTASLSSAATAAAVVSLTDNNVMLTVPASVTISAGSASAAFTATAAAVTTNQTATITATCNSVAKTATVSLTAAAKAPTISSFTASPATITAGASTTLSWSVTGATTLSLSGVGTVTGASRAMTPTQTTTYTLTATNTAGSATATATVTVNSVPVGDTQPPTTPTGLTASAMSSTQINLSWTASTDNVGVAGYRIYRNGAQVGTATGTSYQNTGLTASTSYSYTVAASDAAGNSSAQSAMASATTPAAGGVADVTVTSATQLVNAVNGAQPGQRILITPGTYVLPSRLRITSTNSGAAGQPVTLMAQQGLGSVTLNANCQEEAFLITGSNWLIQDLKVTNANYHGFKIDPPATNIVVRHNTLFDNTCAYATDPNGQYAEVKGDPPTSGSVYVSAITLENNEMYHTRTLAGGGNIQGVDCNACKNWVVRGNRIHDITSTSTGGWAEMKCIQFKSGSDGTIIENNVVYNCTLVGISYGGHGTPSWGGATHQHLNGVVRNNVVYQSGIGISAIDTVNGKVYNNTLFNNGSAPTVELAASNTVFRNNILDRSLRLMNGATVMQSNNLVLSSPADASLFGNAGTCDFHLASSAASAIDRGYNLAADVPTDMDGSARPQGGAFDIGAYEYNGSAPPPPTPTLTGLACVAATASTWTCSASLSSAATAAAVVSLADNNVRLTVPASVTISAGSTSAAFTATAAAVTTTQSATITATYNGVAKTATVTLAPPAATATLSSLTCVAATASTSTCTASLSSAATAAAVVSLADNNVMLTVPASVTISAGSASAAFTATAAAVTTTQSATITATYNGVSRTATVTLSPTAPPPPVVSLASLACTPASLASGASANCIATLSQAAPSGGAVIAISDNSTSLSVPASVTIASAASSAAFTATAGTISAAQSVTVTATFAGVSKTAMISLTVTTTPPSGSTLQVGPTRAYKTPCAAAAAAKAGNTIEIDAGTYRNEACSWTASNLTIRGVGGRAVLDDTGYSIPNGKAIWVTVGSNTTIENVEFMGASVPDQNGAGIRVEGPGLTIRNCYFHNNQDGILGTAGIASNATSDVVIEYSEFANNGAGDGQSHNMYFNDVRSFTLRYSYSHGAKIGHEVKSRALTNYILYNRITDEQGGTASYGIDLPNGGTAYIIGNLMQKSPQADNSTMIAFAAEGGSNPTQQLYVVNNTMVSDYTGGTFVRVFNTPTVSKLINNIFRGTGTVLAGPGTLTSNLSGVDPLFVNQAGFDYHLKAGSPAIGKGTNPGSSSSGFSLVPVSQYVFPTGVVARPSNATIDIGAYAY